MVLAIFKRMFYNKNRTYERIYERVVRVNNRDNPNTVTKEEYREKIVKMVNDIENTRILKLIFGFVSSGYREEKAGR